MIDFIYLLLLLVILPVSQSESTVECDLYRDIPSEKNLREDNPIVQKFLKKHSDFRYYWFTEESSPGYGVMVFENLNRKISLTITTTNECDVPIDYKLKKDSDRFIMLTNNGWPYGTPNNVSSYSDSEITDIVQDYLNYGIYQKWMNHNGDTVYIFPESVDTLIKRGYLAGQINFFDFEKLRLKNR